MRVTNKRIKIKAILSFFFQAEDRIRDRLVTGVLTCALPIFSAITTYVLSGDFKNYYQDYRVNKEIEQIKNHVVICGFGRNGQASHREFAIHND